MPSASAVVFLRFGLTVEFDEGPSFSNSAGLQARAIPRSLAQRVSINLAIFALAAFSEIAGCSEPGSSDGAGTTVIY
jgi:hypothetical protein